jgi:hypothetical protein
VRKDRAGDGNRVIDEGDIVFSGAREPRDDGERETYPFSD